MNNTGREHLEALSKSKSTMAEGQPNVRDWKIVDHTGQQIGTVYDLLFDTEAKKVRYIITNLNNGKLLKQDRLVLMPVGRARYRKSEKEVVFPNVTRDQLSSLPDFLTVDRLTKEDEYSVRNAFRSEGERVTSTGDQDWDSFYDHEDFNEDVFYNRSGAARKEADVDTAPGRDRREEKDRNEPIGTSKNVKAGGGTDSLLTETGGTETSTGNDKKRNEDVNVHPSPEERSADRLKSQENLEERQRNVTDTNKRNEDVNVHPSPEERSTDRLRSKENLEERERNVTNTDRRNEDVNVHPSPEERSTDRPRSKENLEERERNVTDTDRRNKGKIKGDNGRT